MKDLVFDEEFHKRTPADQISYLKKLASSSNEALDMMQKERNKLREEVALLRTQLINAETALSIQKNIVMEIATKSNEDTHGVEFEISELHARIKNLEGLLDGYKR